MGLDPFDHVGKFIDWHAHQRPLGIGPASDRHAQQLFGLQMQAGNTGAGYIGQLPKQIQAIVQAFCRSPARAMLPRNFHGATLSTY